MYLLWKQTVTEVKADPGTRSPKWDVIQDYVLMELRRLAGPMPRSAATIVDMTIFSDGRLTKDGLVFWTLERLHQAREVDLAIFLFCELATMKKGTVRLNSNEAGKAEGVGKFYPRLAIGRSRHQLMRLVENTGRHEITRENRKDHRILLPEAMSVAPTSRRPSKNVQTRLNVIQDVLEAWSNSGEGSDRMRLLEPTLWSLLLIADAHRVEREALAALGQRR